MRGFSRTRSLYCEGLSQNVSLTTLVPMTTTTTIPTTEDVNGTLAGFADDLLNIFDGAGANSCEELIRYSDANSQFMVINIHFF